MSHSKPAIGAGPNGGIAIVYSDGRIDEVSSPELAAARVHLARLLRTAPPPLTAMQARNLQNRIEDAYLAVATAARDALYDAGIMRLADGTYDFMPARRAA